jgi:GDP-L-fucose synthase
MNLREFTYSKDIARAILHLLENYDGIDPVNIGKTGDISIKEVVKIISECLGYSGEIHWDKSKPEGQYKKPSSNEKFLNMFGDFEYTDFRQGIKETCKWFEEKYPQVRGV